MTARRYRLVKNRNSITEIQDKETVVKFMKIVALMGFIAIMFSLNECVSSISPIHDPSIDVG